MKKTLYFFFLLIPLLGNAQTNLVYTVAGGGSTLGDGIPATVANLSAIEGVGVDAIGNVYINDVGHNRIRKVDATTGIITTIAGTGVSGYSGDGGLAINAQINAYGLYADAVGNVYIADMGNIRVRKISATTGIITTVAGIGVIGYSGDGGPAINARINTPLAVYVDAGGNIYFSESSRVRKVDAVTGKISTVATGLNHPMGIITDVIGNLYIAESYGHKITKVNIGTGIITTVAGTGTGGYSGDGGLATAAQLSNPISTVLDSVGNLFIGDNGGRIRKVDAVTGIITTIAGGGSSTAEGVTALSTNMTIEFICMDAAGTLYYSNYVDDKVRKIINFSSPCFTSYVSSYGCSTPLFTCVKNPYSAGLSVKTCFGDGSSATAPMTNVSGNGNVQFNHAYASPGTYSVKHILYDTTAAIDSVHFNYLYTFCNTFAVKLFYDAAGTCIYNPATDSLNASPVTIQVDSNGVPVDTLSVTGGFYYTAINANVGDVYRFKVIHTTVGLAVTCPSTGIIYDTVHVGAASAIKYFGLSCTSSPSFDLSINAVIPVTGNLDQWGNIYVHNNSCVPTNATVTVQFSPKYGGTPNQITPSSGVVSGNTITWNLTGLTSTNTATPVMLHYAIWSASGTLTIGDTVHTDITITPYSGDIDTNNNHCVIVDTVKAGCDPNEMWVSPEGTIQCGSKLHYTIAFENTGNDTAHNIVVLDTLSNNVNAGTFQIGSSSAAMMSSILNDGVHNIVKFEFPNINLLDSSHQQCTGYVTFDINSKAPLAPNTNIDNRAGIYFDYNNVVMTNSVRNTIDDGCPTDVASVTMQKEDIALFPNPASSEVSITSTHTISQVEITNLLGQVVYISTGSLTNKVAVNISSLQAGMYFVKINGTVVRKLVKE
jgi:uncharacterized repeat protein (TIGR01451 family)